MDGARCAEGLFEVGNTGVQGDRGALVRWWTARSRAERRSLLVALGISLVTHAVVLGTMRPQREGDARTPVLRVTLTGTFAAPEHARTPALPEAPVQPVQ